MTEPNQVTLNQVTVTFTPEHEQMFKLLDHLEAAYRLSDYSPIREHIHMAKVEAERHLGYLLLRDARMLAASDEEENKTRSVTEVN